MPYVINSVDIERDVEKLHNIEDISSEHEDEEIHELNSIASHLVGQLVIGCGSSECRNSLCWSGRCNTSKTPIRKHTTRSARIIALSLLFSNDVESKLCRSFKPGTNNVEDDAPRDPTSFEQRLVDTDMVMRITTLHEEKKAISIGAQAQRNARAKTRHISQLCDKIRLPPYRLDGLKNPDFMPNVIAAHHILAVLRYLITYMADLCFPPELLGDHSLLRADLSAAERSSAGSSFREDRRFQTQAITEHLPFCHGLIIMRHVCEALRYRLNLDGLIVKSKGAQRVSAGELVSQQLGRVVFENFGGNKDLPRIVAFFRILQFLIESDWNGHAVITNSSLTFAAISLLNMSAAAQSKAEVRSLSLDFESIGFDSFTKQLLGDLEMAESYLDYEEAGRNDAVHILEFGLVLGKARLASLFSIINHLRMSHSHGTRSIIAGHYHEFFCEAGKELQDPATEARLQNLRQRFLVLRVRRAHVVQDAFSQLWQRPARELYKPLRVRVVEMDGFAMGQDLGGVQIEFFNLVMREIMQEDAGFFSTNETGIAYFKPGSLQPLHMFEYIGILIGLALYNGIAIPIRLPLVLYHILMSEEWTVEHIRDRWKAEATSIEEITSSDVTDWTLSYEFNLATNGVQLVVLPDTDEREPQDMIPLRWRVSKAKSSDKPWDDISLDDIEWPGLKLVAAADNSISVDNDNKTKFCQDYMLWLAQRSVQPQLNAFIRGFHRIIHPYTLKMLHLPHLLQEILEGKDRVDIAVLRSGACYTAFDASDEYINMFWRIVASWSAERQKALVRFITAAERLPRSGDLRVTISRVETEDDRRLPTSSTCFSTLYLPVYSSQETLEKNLVTAVEFGEYGFGIG